MNTLSKAIKIKKEYDKNEKQISFLKEYCLLLFEQKANIKLVKPYKSNVKQKFNNPNDYIEANKKLKKEYKKNSIKLDNIASIHMIESHINFLELKKEKLINNFNELNINLKINEKIYN